MNGPASRRRIRIAGRLLAGAVLALGGAAVLTSADLAANARPAEACGRHSVHPPTVMAQGEVTNPSEVIAGTDIRWHNCPPRPKPPKPPPKHRWKDQKNWKPVTQPPPTGPPGEHVTEPPPINTIGIGIGIGQIQQIQQQVQIQQVQQQIQQQVQQQIQQIIQIQQQQGIGIGIGQIQQIQQQVQQQIQQIIQIQQQQGIGIGIGQQQGIGIGIGIGQQQAVPNPQPPPAPRPNIPASSLSAVRCAGSGGAARWEFTVNPAMAFNQISLMTSSGPEDAYSGAGGYVQSRQQWKWNNEADSAYRDITSTRQRQYSITASAGRTPVIRVQSRIAMLGDADFGPWGNARTRAGLPQSARGGTPLLKHMFV